MGAPARPAGGGPIKYHRLAFRNSLQVSTSNLFPAEGYSMGELFSFGVNTSWRASALLMVIPGVRAFLF
jgi:hypothetical protein